MMRTALHLHLVSIYSLIATVLSITPVACFAAVDGRPPGTGAGAGPPGRGPPPGTAAPGGLETFFEKAWPILYAFDGEGKVRDSSKNLRVLWTRALLSNLGKIDDPIAYELLPRGTREIVGSLAARTVWRSPIGSPAVGKLDWIADRTNFIDSQLTSFLDETSGGKRQVVVLGAGYDTRSLRFRREGLTFFEIDLPDVAGAKESMMGKFLRTDDDGGTTNRPTHVGFDLNEIVTQDKSLIDELVRTTNFELDRSVPTMIICEAVLFYLMPEAAQGLVKELFALPNAQRYCFTDNLAKLGVGPGPPVPTPRDKCKGWLDKEGKTLIDHNAIWGGAIHFVAAK